MSFTITIVALGRKNATLDEETDRYVSFIKPYATVRVLLVKPPPIDSSDNGKIIMEGRLLQSKWPTGSYPVALSEEGKLMESLRFATWIESFLTSHRSPVFNIGGAFGLSSNIKKECKEIISLSPLTLPHKLCMLVLIEQIYRAFTILHNHPYHK